MVHKKYLLIKRSIIICSACVGYNCPKYALCRDVSTYDDPYAICECQLGRIMNSEGIQFQMIYYLYMITLFYHTKTNMLLYLILCIGDKCIIPPLTTPIPKPDPTLPPDIKTAVQAGEKSASSLLICFLLATIAVFAFMKIYTTSRVIQMNMEISLILAHVLAVILPNFSDNILVFCLNYLKSLIHTYT